MVVEMKTRIKEMRLIKNMTQQQLADLVHVSSRTIISIEKEPITNVSVSNCRSFRYYN